MSSERLVLGWLTRLESASNASVGATALHLQLSCNLPKAGGGKKVFGPRGLSDRGSAGRRRHQGSKGRLGEIDVTLAREV